MSATTLRSSRSRKVEEEEQEEEQEVVVEGSTFFHWPEARLRHVMVEDSSDVEG